jgi:hypothetical protein
LSAKSEQVEWRRSKVIEMRARGLSYQEIARELQVSKASITSDVQYVREQAKGTIKAYVTEHLSEQYQVCLSALDTILYSDTHLLLFTLIVAVKLNSASVTSSFICTYLLTCLYCIIMGIPHLLVVVVELPLKKLLSEFTTKTGCSSGIK